MKDVRILSLVEETMFGFKKKTQLSNDVKKKALTLAMQRAKEGRGDSFRVLFAEALGNNEVGPDSEIVTALQKEVAFHGLPKAEKDKGVDFSTWWTGATPEERTAAVDTAMAWIFSR